MASLGPQKKSIQDTEFDIWKLIRRSDTTNPYSLTLRYRSDGKKLEAASKRHAAVSRRRRRRGRPESGTESDSSDSNVTSNTDLQDNDSYFKEEYDFDAEDPPDPPLYPHLEHKPGTFLQELYRKACKEFGVVRYTKFYNGLASDRIVMRRQNLCPLDVKSCAIALMESYSIHTLDLSENNIGPPGATYIAELLVENQFIKHLFLQNNNLQRRGVISLVSVIKKFDSLTTLDLSGNSLQEDDAEALKPLFTDTVNLKVLNLSHNEFQEKGGKFIGEALDVKQHTSRLEAWMGDLMLESGRPGKHYTLRPKWGLQDDNTIIFDPASNDTLENLDLSWNHLRRQGAVKIAEALTNNSSLLVLNLSWNGFHCPGCNALAKALGKNTTLKELDICSNRIDEELLNKLINGLKRNSTLKTLRIGQNPLSPEALNEFLLFIKNNAASGIAMLDFRDQLVKSSFLEIVEEIRKNRPLDVIYGRVKDHNDSPVGNEEKSLLQEDPVVILIEFGKLMGFRLVDLFAALDKDGSRSLDHFEIKNGLKALNLPMNDMCIDILIKKLDKDLDGKIDFGELMSASTRHRQKSAEIFSARNQKINIEVEQTEIGQVRAKLHRLMKKRMSENPEFKGNVENMKRTLLNYGGETKLRQEMLKRMMELRTNNMA